MSDVQDSGSASELLPAGQDEDDEKDIVPSHLGTHMVTITVGPDEILYIIHKDILQETTSPFFRVCFNNGFAEQRLSFLALPEDDPKAFNTFCRWAYGRVSGFTECSKAFLEHMPMSELLDLYIFSHKYIIQALEDAIIATVMYKAHRSNGHQMGFTRASLERLEARTPFDTNMRKLLVDTLAWTAKNRSYWMDEALVEMLPVGLMRGAFLRLYQPMGMGPPPGFNGNKCHYHAHPINDLCEDGWDGDDTRVVMVEGHQDN
ncbi:hypothetical protein M406DRAFT_68743 [Cryphonectria parasitica EP155]|uniref:BTB domain-containing protein n=1 Tax=Cryphonectria parasitica (strain ATCC 38755 / EP155) TaxID=660469 RepID=A0A9P4Y4B2_CRYP1|nr:uncharacterized protein M406DRAFT_68743 [Cryphonectria parasitica EP155]KAF3766396.1 hypothetical protein M406DRAFT_68743 [Cryphonectria parasitica EP155]